MRPPAGQLTQLSFNGWNLAGTFPTDQLARFSALSELDLSNNYAMNADLKQMFDAFSQLQNIQVRVLLLTNVNGNRPLAQGNPKAACDLFA